MENNICQSCELPSAPGLVRGLCRKCYSRCKYNGTLEMVATAPSRQARVPLGTRTVNKAGYAHIQTRYGKMPEHHVVMEAHLGRNLVRGESVRHKDGVRDNNALDNLELYPPKGLSVRELKVYMATYHS